MSHRLGLIALESAINSGLKVDKILKEWRGNSSLIECSCPRFNSGEGKAMIMDSVRDKDIYIMVDICNNTQHIEADFLC